MSKYSVKVKDGSNKTAVRKADPDAVEVATPAPRSGGFFSFRYSYTEFSSQGGRTRVKAKQARLEDGKLSTETFEGELEGHVVDEAVRQAQQLVLGQAAWFLRSLSWLLPPMRGTRSDRE
jgi:hypothetical protein